YGKSFKLGPLNLDFQTGTTCVVGPNGAGKSTLFDLICGLAVPTTGSALVCGDARLGLLPQDVRLPPRASCEEFLAHVAWLQRVPPNTRTQAVRAALDAVDLRDRASTRIRGLSGGMVRRLGIAQAIVHDPDVVVLDEPTAGLDPLQRASLRRLIADLGTSRCMLVSTHLVEDVRGLADRVLVLNSGDVVFDGLLDELAQFAEASAPGDTELERAFSVLMAGDTR
ncbi:MAG: ATP-binding cassette domain-containing protein, partial [Actinomycetia bacterium]|nr:ATP-binding cassette domain-containing protein [Actinomycetes bacterium]